MCSRTRVINAERFRRLLSHKRGFANLQSVIVTASILSWFVHILKYVMFGVKDPTLVGSVRVWFTSFLCAGCDACYVGKTSLIFRTEDDRRTVETCF